MPYSHEIFEFENLGVKYLVEYYIVPASPRIDRYANGDPGEPGEEAHCEIVSVKYDIDKEPVEQFMLMFLYDEIEEQCWNLHKQLLNDV